MVLLHSPPPSFDDPMEMLTACHEKVRHFARLATRLAEHVQQHGADNQAVDAATAVIRYFDVAAPLHHADEDDDLYPALIKLGDPSLTANIQRLSAEHESLADLWCIVKLWLMKIQSGQADQPPAEFTEFALRYPQHARDEESLIYPHAQRLGATLLGELGQKMASRRRH